MAKVEAKRAITEEVSRIAALEQKCAELVRDNARLRSMLEKAEPRSLRDALELSESRLRQISESGIIGIIYWEVGGGIVDANDAFLRCIGYSRSDIETGALNWKAITPPEYAKADLAAVRQLTDRGRLDPYEKEYLRKDGTRIPVLIAGATLEPEPSVGVALVLDLTERKRALEDLEIQLGITKAITDHALEALFMLDAEGRTTFASPAAIKMFGFSEKELLGRPIHGLLHHHHPDGSSFPAEECPVLLSFRAGAPLPYHEDVFFRKDGTKVFVACSNAPIKTDGALVGSVMAVSDITERKLAEEALRESEHRLASALDIAKLGVWTFNVQGDIGEMDARCREVLGLPDHGVISPTAVRERVHPRDRARLDAALRDAMDPHGKGELEAEQRVMRPDNSVRWVAMHGKGTRSGDDPEKPYDRFVGTLMDITDLKKAEENERRLNDTLEHRVAERTAELEAANADLEGFTYSVAHDLRAPLRAINATSRILESELRASLTPDQTELLKRQVFNSAKLAQLIDDLLKISRIGRQNLEMEPIDMGRLACESARHFDNCKAEIEVEPGMMARGDPKLIRFLFDNLLDNACKYSPDGGTIRVGKILGNGESVYFVRDQGIGFDMRYAEKIFLPFERLHRDADFPGTGIGLANVKRIVERHGGRIWAESQPGHGSTFYFTLPSQ